MSVSYTPVELAQAYNFPAGTDGAGQTIAIIELGGGYEQSDLDTYFQGLGLTSPAVTAVGVDGAANQPGQDPQGADGEVLLDIEVAGAVAPAAAISVYFGPNTDAGFLDAVSDAVHAAPAPAAISISWGQREDQWTAQARTAMDSVFADAAQLGIVVTAAAGDSGSGDGATDGSDHCDFPASSPNVIGCGGTSLPTLTGAETVWNNGFGNGATGGGVSTAFARPARQASVGVPGSSGRGVPDVAGNADPRTGYQVLVDGTRTVIGGTSAVAPLWAGLVARLAQATGGPLTGFADALYAGASAGTSPAGFRDVTEGTTAATPRARGGMPAPASAARTGRRCWRGCRRRPRGRDAAGRDLLQGSTRSCRPRPTYLQRENTAVTSSSDPAPTTAEANAARHAAEPSLGQLVNDASESVSTIIRGEIELAKLELRSSVKNAGVGVGLFVAAAVLLAYSLTFGLLSLAEGLVALGLYRWLAYLVVFALLVVLVALLVFVGVRKVKRVKAPQRTIDTGRDTVAYLKSHPKSPQSTP